MDITLDYRRFDDDFDPFAEGASRNRIRLLSQRLRSRAASYVSDVVAPSLDATAERLGADGQYQILVGDDGKIVRFIYLSAVENHGGHIKSEVLVKFSGRNVITPNEQHTVVPDVAYLTPALDYPASTVTALSPRRTVWGLYT